MEINNLWHTVDGARNGSFAVADTIAKVLLEHYPPAQVVFLRQLGLFFGVNFLMVYNLNCWEIKKLNQAVTPRFICNWISCYIPVGLRTIPIADAGTAFVAPLFVIIFSYFVLKEPIGIRRWLAVVIGFSGIDNYPPGFEVINLGHLFIIIAHCFLHYAKHFLIATPQMIR